ncbi:FAD-binding oxidoreductase [Roseovarius sp. SK2]|jgi:FAD/FMN-containing dehydrogenase|uniref:FAD-binding oxidoreductase n=1 Tax=Roseovarius TaxID=74030 RepID=UPI00237C47CE|nr:MULTISPECIES: FAD-binding oxidoreductase [unclassified Roseovarius]MDD9724625.1 FAD-binding oxidoreductase [Roseovarius sp. SK2]
MTDHASTLGHIKDVTVLTAALDMAPHLIDWRKRHTGQAECVVFPSTTQAVSEVMAYCHANRIRVFPQGGNTSVCGGSVPDGQGGSIVLNLSRMNRLREINPNDDSMVVDAGCILANVQQAAADVDRLFPLRLGAEGSCQIGGNIATNAGGTAAVRYGVMRDLVLGLEVVLPDGTIIDAIKTVRKDNSGFDLKHLFIGSEGTIGIITGAALKLFARPRGMTTAALAIRDIDTALYIARDLRGALPGEISALELLSDSEMEIVREFRAEGALRMRQAPWYLIVEVGGRSTEAEYRDILETLLMPELESGALTDAILAENERQRGEIWGVRHSVTECNMHAGMGLTHDIAVPIGKLDQYIKQAEAELAEAYPDAVPVVVGHIGDGNLHYIAMFTHEAWAAQTAQEAVRDHVGHMFYDIAVGLGGTFSAEHGVGSIHTGDMERYKSSSSLRMMRDMKAAFDPLGIANPGRMLKFSIDENALGGEIENE